jgi:hypothetical protein
MVGNPYLTGLRKGCSSSVHKPVRPTVGPLLAVLSVAILCEKTISTGRFGQRQSVRRGYILFQNGCLEIDEREWCVFCLSRVLGRRGGSLKWKICNIACVLARPCF